MYQLGFMYFMEMSVKKHKKTSYDFYVSSATLGNSKSQSYLGVFITTVNWWERMIKSLLIGL